MRLKDLILVLALIFLILFTFVLCDVFDKYMTLNDKWGKVTWFEAWAEPIKPVNEAIAETKETVETVETVETDYPMPEEYITWIKALLMNRKNLTLDLVLGVIQAESSFHADSVSSCGAVGYMQVMPYLTEWLSGECGVKDLTDPYDNLNAGTWILNKLIDDYDGDVEKALIAYNCGATGAYEQYFSKGVYSNGYSRTVLKYAEEWK